MSIQLFRHKVCLVTGSSRGIGRAIARALLEAGATVVLNGRDPIRLRQTQAAFEAEGFAPDLLTADVTDWPQIEAGIAQVVAAHGRLDYVINNAGLSFQGAFDQTQPAVFRKLLEANVLGCLYPTLAALPHLRSGRGGVLFIGSIAGLYGLPHGGIYSMTKLSLKALVESLRLEYEAEGLYAGLLYVGLTENDPEKTLLGPDGKMNPAPDRKVRRQPQARVAWHALDMVQRHETFRVLTPLGRMTAFLAKWAPWVVRLILRRQMHRFRQAAPQTAKPPAAHS